MTRFVNQVAQILRNIFNFEGSLSSLSRFDLTSDIQPVFDLSSGAAFARAAEHTTSVGLFGMRLTMTHVATGDLFHIRTDIYGELSTAIGVPVDNLWVWIMDVEGYADDETDFAAAQLVMIDPAIDGTPEPAPGGRLIMDCTSLVAIPISGDTEFPFRPNIRQVFPMLVTPGAALEAGSESDGSGTIVINVIVRLWVGPRFANPPGA